MHPRRNEVVVACVTIVSVWAGLLQNDQLIKIRMIMFIKIFGSRSSIIITVIFL